LTSFSEVLEKTRSLCQGRFRGHVFDKQWFLDVGLRYSHTDTTSNAYSTPLLAITVNPNDTSNALPTYGALSPISDKGAMASGCRRPISAQFAGRSLFRLALSKTEAGRICPTCPPRRFTISGRLISASRWAT